MKQDENVVLWNFGELIKNLITLSVDAVRQAELIGYGHVSGEMGEDFDTYYTYRRSSYIEHGLLNIDQKIKLDSINIFLNERSQGKSPDFWDDKLLETSPDWEEVRRMAKETLRLLNMDDLAISYDRKEDYDKVSKLTVQYTRSHLIKKTPN